MSLFSPNTLYDLFDGYYWLFHAGAMKKANPCKPKDFLFQAA
jgi:hypothetical protein